MSVDSAASFGVRFRLSSSLINELFSYNIIGLNHLQEIVLFTKRHNLIIGTDLLREKASTSKKYYLGLICGYQYDFVPSKSGINFFFRCNFFFNQVEYEQHGIMSGTYYEKKNIILNTVGLGINYKITNKFCVYGDFGLGLNIPVTLINIGVGYNLYENNGSK